MKILNVEFNRNGSNVCEGFTAVLFEDKRVSKEFAEGLCGNEFIATFRTNKDGNKIIWESFRCMNVKNFNLNFRGDHFISDIEKAIIPYCKKLNLKENSIIAASFPSQYKKEKIKSTLNPSL